MELIMTAGVESMAGDEDMVRATSTTRAGAKMISKSSWQSERTSEDAHAKRASTMTGSKTKSSPRDDLAARLSVHISERVGELTSTKTAGGRGDGEIVTVLRGPTKPAQGQGVKQIIASPGFIFSFNFRLLTVPTETVNILNCAITGVKDCHLPSISICGGSMQLVVTMQLGNVHVKVLGPEEGLELNRTTKISLKYHRETITFDVGPRRTVEKDVKLDIPLPCNFQVYVSGHSQEAANGFVDSVYYQPLLDGEIFGQQKFTQVKEFELPPAEQRLLEETKSTIQKNRKWARFDAFFGIFLIANSLLIGLEIEFNNDNSHEWVVAESIFIVAFTIELLLRIHLMRLSTCMSFLRDPWLVFDAAVIVQSMVETWILPDIPGYLSVLRLIRLLKLAKMVRLVRAFRELGILVEGVLSSFHTLFWTMVLLIICTYVGALVLVRTAQLEQEEYTAAERDRLVELLDVPTAMWRLLSMSTFDQWATYVRSIAFGISGWKGTALAVELIIFLSFIGLGILNMVAGILCHTAFELNQKYKHMKGVELLLVQQKAMRSLETSLRTWGERPLFQNDRYIGMDEFFDVLAKNERPGGNQSSDEVTELVDDPLQSHMTPAEAVKLLMLSGDELLSLCDTFAEDGHIEIDGLIEAIQIKELQAYYGLKSRDWIGAKNASPLRPVDMVSFNTSISSVEKCLANIERSSTGVCSLAYDSLRHLHEQAKQADTLLRMDKAAWRAPSQHHSDFAPSFIDVKDLENCVNRAYFSTEDHKLSLPIDLFFGVLIVCNGLFIGVQLAYQANEDLDDVFYGIDVFFTLVFIFEVVIRAMLFTHMKDINAIGEEDENLHAAGRRRLAELVSLRKRMRCSILPPCPPSGCVKVLTNFPLMIADIGSFLDFLLVVLSFLDTAVIAILRRLALTSADPSILSVLRIFRLFRLAKALRVFRVFPYLQLFIFALFRVWKTVMWTLLLMLLFIYGFSLYSLVMIQPTVELRQFFGDLPSCMLTGWKLTTFDQWAEVLQGVAKYSPINVIVILLMVVFLGLGLMKMLIGVMSESAISLMQTREVEKQREDLTTFIQEMANLSHLFQEEFGTDLMPQEIIENALGINIRPKRSVMNGGESDMNPAMSLPLKMLKAGQSKQFTKKLLHIFRRAKLSPDLVKQVWEKVDYRRTGYVNTNVFALSAMVVKEDATKIQVFASITAIRQVKHLCTELDLMLQSVHQQMESLLEDMCTLITRKRYTGRFAEKSSGGSSGSLGTFGSEAASALRELSGFSGTVPAVRSMGRLKVVNGHGLLGFDGDEALGIGTKLRSELKPGDTIIVGARGDPSEEQEMLAFTVVSIIGHERIKISRKFPPGNSGAQLPFLIVKQTEEGWKDYVRHESTEFTHNLHVQSELSPRSAQLFFEWELSMKKRHDVKFQELDEERVQLTREMVELLRDLEALANHQLAQQCYDAWREWVKISRQMKKDHDAGYR